MENFEQVVDAITNLNREEEQALAVGIMIGMTFNISGANKRHSETEEQKTDKRRNTYIFARDENGKGIRLNFLVADPVTAFKAVQEFIALFYDYKYRLMSNYVTAKSLFNILKVTPSTCYDALRFGWKEMRLSDIRMEEQKDGTYLLSFPEPEDYGED